MRKDREKATQLRKSGLSYKRISRELGIAPSTLSAWFKNEPWSQELKHRLSKEVSLSNPRKLKIMTQATKEKWRLKHEEFRKSAVRDFKNLKNDPLFISAISLYWSKGDKAPANSLASLKSSDPEILHIFNMFLIKSLNISPTKIHARLVLYPDLVDSVQKNLWSRMIGIPIAQFKKSSYIKTRQSKKRTSYGTCTIYVSSRALKEKVLKWIKLYQDHLRSLALKD